MCEGAVGVVVGASRVGRPVKDRWTSAVARRAVKAATEGGSRLGGLGEGIAAGSGKSDPNRISSRGERG
jgi:hypothetical protein